MEKGTKNKHCDFEFCTWTEPHDTEDHKIDPPIMGRKDDQEKLRYDLIPPEPIQDLANVLTFGAKKYAPNNWQLVPDGKTRYYAALMRHMEAWRMGEFLDPESKLPHLAHALCCLVFLSWLDNPKKIKCVMR